MVQAHGHRVGIVAFDDDAGAPGAEAEHVRIGLREAEFDLVGGLPEEAVGQGRCGLRVGIVVPRGGNAAGRQEGGRCKQEYLGFHLTK